jgi:leucyl-tRNA synthetase
MKEVAERLSAIGQGSVAVTYHLHDWLISRQRFWGAPIPIIHCDNCGTVPVPEKELPVLLPEGDIDFKPKGKSPLAMVEEFIKVRCPKCGEEAQRDADTMDTFVCSSWYYFRYLCANMQDQPFDSAILNRWMPVDQYVGGSEHINGHLLYSRFICKVLYDEGLINFEEPFTALRHQGIITNKGAKMSKSKGNVVNPETFTHKFGSDVFRLYMMFMGDYEQGGDWSDEGIIGVERFVNRIWRLYQEHWPVPENKNEVKVEPELLRILHYTIKSVGEDIPNFKFNTAISRIMELVNGLYNHFGSKPAESLDSNFLKQSFKSLPLIIAPLAPHLGEELWSIVSGEGSVFNQSWPKYDPSALNVDTIEIALQVNGKMRGTMTITRGSEESKVFEQAESLPGIAKYLVEKSILRKIYIKDKLLNIVAK